MRGPTRSSAGSRRLLGLACAGALCGSAGPALAATAHDWRWHKAPTPETLYQSVTGGPALDPPGGGVRDVEAQAGYRPQGGALLVKRETLDWLPAVVLGAFLLLFLVDRVRPRTIE